MGPDGNGMPTNSEDADTAAATGGGGRSSAFVCGRTSNFFCGLRSPRLKFSALALWIPKQSRGVGRSAAVVGGKRQIAAEQS